ncbi:MAG: sulfite exporter TauE/SafE family protein [Dehalococcoidia bacterium]|nr:MAG: sulfite exporter TauE/SafE family protein [Dehalococcoidia bacterium]
MGVVEYLGLLVAAFVAGAINAVAGGGSLISFPALLAAGFASKTANVTNTVALWPGYAGGSYGYRSELSRQRRRFLYLAAPAILGALVGSVVLLATPGSAFDVLVPFLILFACTMMAFQDQLSRWAQAHRLASRHDEHVPFALLASTFVSAIYGAYFGAALGIITLAFLAILLPDDIQHSNALKGLLSLLINAVAVVYFAIFGPVRWLPVAVMAVGAVAGGYLGVGVARRLGRQWLRLVVIGYGVVVATVLLVQLAV